jgi:hypothetical protein
MAAAQDDRFAHCLQSLLKIRTSDQNDGRKRLFAAACRCVVKNQIGDALLATLNLRRRLKRIGACKRGADDSSAEFYAKLPPWLERDIPPT